MTRPGGLFRLLALALSIAVGLGAPEPAKADAGDDVAAELRAAGYTEVTIERTLLGRIRVVAQAPGRRREVVIDRGTGEILRDLTEEEGSASPPPPSTGANG